MVFLWFSTKTSPKIAAKTLRNLIQARIKLKMSLSHELNIPYLDPMKKGISWGSKYQYLMKCPMKFHYIPFISWGDQNESTLLLLDLCPKTEAYKTGVGRIFFDQKFDDQPTIQPALERWQDRPTNPCHERNNFEVRTALVWRTCNSWGNRMKKL